MDVWLIILRKRTPTTVMPLTGIANTFLGP